MIILLWELPILLLFAHTRSGSKESSPLISLTCPWPLLRGRKLDIVSSVSRFKRGNYVEPRAPPRRRHLPSEAWCSQGRWKFCSRIQIL